MIPFRSAFAASASKIVRENPAKALHIAALPLPGLAESVLEPFCEQAACACLDSPALFATLCELLAPPERAQNARFLANSAFAQLAARAKAFAALQAPDAACAEKIVDGLEGCGALLAVACAGAGEPWRKAMQQRLDELAAIPLLSPCESLALCQSRLAALDAQNNRKILRVK